MNTPHDLDFEARRAALLESIGHQLPPHADYPHYPGYLSDCPRCESECFCHGEDSTFCTYCARRIGQELRS